MKLITPELERRFSEAKEDTALDQTLFLAKFLNPCGNEVWYASEYDAKTNMCYGYVTGREYADDWEFFSIPELEARKLPFGLSIQRELYFEEITLEEVLNPIGLRGDFDFEKFKRNREQSEELER
tara:strand:- start:4544 stop:4918 length:375 start_codon:yes stop_codon:yes gene_type:complete